MTSPSLTPRWVSQVLKDHGILKTLKGPVSDQPFTSIQTDSRRVAPGCLFVPLKGDKFDGHDFIPQAVAQGAAAVLCSESRSASIRCEPSLFFLVEDSQEAYRQLGAAWRRLFKIPVVMVAGSAGKTTTKELLTACLTGRWPQVLKTQGSQNGFVGIPMTLLELRPDHGAAVIEVGIDEIGAMEQHVRIVRPDLSLLTAIGPEHLEKLQNIETVAREEGIGLTAVARHGGQVAVNLDDRRIAPYYAKVASARTRLGYALHDRAGPAGPDRLQGALSPDLAALEVRGGRFEGLERFELPLRGEHNAMNLLSAVAACQLLGLGADEIRQGLRSFSGAEGRSQLRSLEQPVPVQVLCDYYNSQPASLEAGLVLLNQLAGTPGAGATTACLADMLELGTEEERYHRDAAGPILRLGVRNVLLYGPRMRWLGDELRRRGFSGRLEHFETHERLAARLLSWLEPRGVILIKGSRGMRMEEVWKALESQAQRTEQKP